MKKKCLIIAVTLTLVMGMAGVSFGAIVDWTEWTSATVGTSGSATGTIGSISVTYSGEVNSATQTSGVGTYYYDGSPSPYTSVTVANAPLTSDIIALVGGNNTTKNTITFSSPVTDPVMAIVSLGSPYITETYNFDQPFTILSGGAGYWGGGTITITPPSSNILQGVEGNGVIQFSGSISSISWTVPTSEDFHGFTVGVPFSFNPVPLPGAVWLLGSGLVGLGFLRRKRKTAA